MQKQKQHFKVCLCWRRIFKTRVVEPPPDVQELFYRFSPSGMMTVDQLLKFLVEFQGEKGATKEDAHSIFDSLKHLSIFQRKGLHLEAFFRYLLGDHNLAHPPSQKVIDWGFSFFSLYCFVELSLVLLRGIFIFIFLF